MAKQPWAKAGIEPPLHEVLADPIVASLMKADRITINEVLASTRQPARAIVREDQRIPA
jgi:hypothetical protein